jgi:hypothetical protein
MLNFCHQTPSRQNTGGKKNIKSSTRPYVNLAVSGLISKWEKASTLTSAYLVLVINDQG